MKQPLHVAASQMKDCQLNPNDLSLVRLGAIGGECRGGVVLLVSRKVPPDLVHYRRIDVNRCHVPGYDRTR